MDMLLHRIRSRQGAPASRMRVQQAVASAGVVASPAVPARLQRAACRAGRVHIVRERAPKMICCITVSAAAATCPTSPSSLSFSLMSTGSANPALATTSPTMLDPGVARATVASAAIPAAATANDAMCFLMSLLLSGGEATRATVPKTFAQAFAATAAREPWEGCGVSLRSNARSTMRECAAPGCGCFARGQARVRSGVTRRAVAPRRARSSGGTGLEATRRRRARARS